MKIVDDSTQNEKSSSFYLKNAEVVDMWKCLAEELNGEISGSFNAYMIELEIKAAPLALIAKGVKQQYTAQSDTLYPENSHNSESTTLIFKVEGALRTLKVGKPNFFQKVFRLSRKGSNSEYITKSHLLTSDSIDTLQKARKSMELQSVVKELDLRYLRMEPRNGLLKFFFNQMFVKKEQFDAVFQLKEKMIKENWC